MHTPHRRITRGLVGVALALAALFLPSRPGFLQAQVTWRTLEQAGSLEEALASLRVAAAADSTLAPALAARTTAWDALLAADSYRKTGQRERALAAVDKGLGDLDVLRDVAWVVRLSALRDSLIRDIRAQAVEDTLRIADDFLAVGRDSAAYALYSQLSQRGADQIGPQARDRALAGVSRTRPDRFFDTFFQETLRGFSQLARVAMYLILALAVVGLLLLLQRWWAESYPKPGTLLAFEDLTTSASDRAAASHRLTQDIYAQIQALARSDRGGEFTDDPNDLDQTALTMAQPSVDVFDVVDSVVPDAGAVQVGPLSFSPTQILTALRSLLARPHAQEIRGTLRADGQSRTITFRRSSAKGGAGDRAWVDVRADGADADAEVVARAATRIGFELGTPKSTRNWQSYGEYRRAMRLLAEEGRGAERTTRLEAAEAALLNAVKADAGNLLARFQLGVVLRKLGRNRDAECLFQLLLKDVRRADGAVADARFGLSVEYNLAVTISKLGWEGNDKALGTLSTLETELAKQAAPGEDSGDELIQLRFLVWSAQATAVAYRLEKLRRSSRAAEIPPKLMGRLEEDFKELPEAVSKIEEQRRRLGGDDSRESRHIASLAEAIAKSAESRALRVFGGARATEAESRAREAIAIMPDLAEAHILLAEILLHDRSRVDHHDAEEVERSLLEALDRSPSNRRAHRLLAELYRRPLFARYEAALEHLRRGGNARDLHQAAQVLLRDLGKPEEALTEIRRSFDLDPEPNDRALTLADIVLDLPVTGRTRVLAEEAAAKVRALQKAGKKKESSRLERGAEHFLGRLEKLLEELAKDAPVPESQAAGASMATQAERRTNDKGGDPGPRV